MKRRSSGHDLRLNSLQVRAQSVGNILHALHTQINEFSIFFRSLELNSQLWHSILVVVLDRSVLILLLEDDLILFSDLCLREESDIKNHSVVDAYIND